MKNLKSYTVGWICAIKEELIAAKVFLDEEHGLPDHVPHDDNNTYILGRIGMHNVVIATLPGGQYGIVSASTVARDMVRSFPGVRIGLMVGIGGGAPSPKHDIRLGDIVISSPSSTTGGVLQYDYGKTIQGKKFSEKGHLNQPPQLMLTALSVLEAEYESEGHRIEEAIDTILRKKPRMREKYRRPDARTDRLYVSIFTHRGDEKASCIDVCGDNESNIVLRRDPMEGRDSPTVHRGLIASASQLMKDALIRDTLSKEKDILCFEMEAAGLMNHFPCVVIRGICDYSDTHKNDAWQGYAAVAAAACAKDLLSKIAPNKVEAERTLGEILSNVNIKIDDIWSMAIDAKKSKHIKKICEWFSAPDPSTNLNDALQRRHLGSGSWFLGSEKFLTWRTERNSFLWLSGSSGCGKTVLSSSIIKELEKCSQRPLYFYFDFLNPGKQTLGNALRRLILQLYCKESNVQHHLDSLHASWDDDSIESPNIKLLQETFQHMIQQAGEQWIVIDALDECGTQRELSESVLPWIKSLQNTQTNVHLLVTSRPEHDIKSAIEKWANSGDIINLQSALIQEDIYRYTQARLKTGKLGERWESQPDVLYEIEKAVIWKAEGMFRLVACQLDELEFCINRPMVRESLKFLPSTLNETYARILQKIPNEYLRSTILILQFLVYSTGTLTIDQLVDAVTVDITRRDSFDPNDRMPIPMEIMRLCSSLVVTTTMTGSDMRRFYGSDYALEYGDEEEVVVVKLAHSSVKEYLTSTRLEGDKVETFSEVNARTSIAEICIAHLLQLREQGSIQLGYSQLVRAYPLAKYAARYWASHAQVVESHSTVITDLIVELLSCEQAFSLCNSIYPICRLHQDKSCHPDKLNFAANHGLLPTAKRLINDGVDVNALDTWPYDYLYANRPLWTAVVGDNYEMAELLLNNGASCDTEDASALAVAASLGNSKIVQLLLDNNADRNGHEKDDCVALRAAVDTGFEDIVKMLLNSGADINFACKDHGTALEAAVLNGERGMAKLLLDRGADVNVLDGETNLHFAIHRGYVDLAILLIEHGANPNAEDIWGITPLHLAIMCNFENVVRLLIDRGANVNAEDRDGKTPLLLAVCQGLEDISSLLIGRGADINVEDNEGRTLLHIAVIRAQRTVSKLLTDHGATINAENRQGKTPLQLAISVDFNLEISHLIDFGADINVSNIGGRTLVHIARQRGREEVARVLRERGSTDVVLRAPKRRKV